MEYENIIIDGFSIIGISVRTTNKEGQSQQDISTLWGRLMEENLIAQIPNKISDEIYCLYTDYENDYTGAYSTLLGCKVSSINEIPEGFTGKHISKTEYRKYTAIGKMPDAVGAVWMHIWQSDSEINRQYLADFDVYGIKSQNGNNSEVDIYLSVTP